MTTQSIQQTTVDTIDNLIDALNRFKTGDGSTNYISLENLGTGTIMVHLDENILSDGSKTYDIRLVDYPESTPLPELDDFFK